MAELIEKSASATSLTQDAFLQSALKFIRQHSLFEAGERVLVACSGGLDSTVLAHILTRIAPLMDIEVEVAHVDHRTRSLASEREGVWVQVLADRLGIKSHLLTLEPLEKGSQAEWRLARREALVGLMQDTGAKRIALAHHADDNAETFLMKAMQGTGTRGLAGISPGDGLWVRPLLWATRSELEDYARSHRLGWVEDPSNARGNYLRNRMRKELFPLLDELREGASRNLGRLAQRFYEEEREWHEWTTAQLADGPAESLSLGWLERWPRALQRRILHTWMRKLGLGADPAVVEKLLNHEDSVSSEGAFLHRSDMLIFSAEDNFGSLWKTPLKIETGRRVSLGRSMAWCFLQSDKQAIVPHELTLYFVFRQPGSQGEQASLLSWERTPWPLIVRTARADDHVVFDRLEAAGVPRPYWRQWPVVVSEQEPNRVVAVVGFGLCDEECAHREGDRAVSMESFLEARLPTQNPSASIREKS